MNGNQSLFEAIGGRLANKWCKFDLNKENSKYRAVNLCPPKTIELRFFKSSLEKEEVLGRIECAMAIVSFCMGECELTIDNFLSMVYTS